MKKFLIISMLTVLAGSTLAGGKGEEGTPPEEVIQSPVIMRDAEEMKMALSVFTASSTGYLQHFGAGEDRILCYAHERFEVVYYQQDNFVNVKLKLPLKNRNSGRRNHELSTPK